MRIFSIIIICIFISYNAHAFTIQSGQVWSSDGNVYDFASSEEKKKLIEKYKKGGDQVGVFNNQLFIIMDEDIINIPMSDLRGKVMLKLIQFWIKLLLILKIKNLKRKNHLSRK